MTEKEKVEDKLGNYGLHTLHHLEEQVLHFIEYIDNRRKDTLFKSLGMDEHMIMMSLECKKTLKYLQDAEKKLYLKQKMAGVEDE